MCNLHIIHNYAAVLNICDYNIINSWGYVGMCVFVCVHVSECLHITLCEYIYTTHAESGIRLMHTVTDVSGSKHIAAHTITPHVCLPTLYIHLHRAVTVPTAGGRKGKRLYTTSENVNTYYLTHTQDMDT